MGAIRQKKCVMIIAGEASGDHHGARLVRSMRQKDRNLFFYGIGGKALADEGVRILVNAVDLSVVGLTEIIPKMGNILRGLKIAKGLLKNLRPDLLILIDFPGFNLHIATTAKRWGIPVLYYISPQIWAWRSGRVKKIKKRVDHVAVILPFETDFYEKHDVPVTFVGHPLLDKPYDFAKGKKEIGRFAIGLMPGSRDGEVIRHLPTMLEAADILKNKHSNAKFYISQAPTVEKMLIEDIVRKHGKHSAFHIMRGDIDKFFRKCRFVIAVSGTVTLEAAIAGVPMVIIYKMSPLSYRMARLLIRGVKYVGLVNLVAGKNLVPELLQGQASPEKIAETVSEMLNNDKRIVRLRDEFIHVRKILGETGASKRAADIALNMM